MESGFDPAGFSNVDAAASPGAYSENLDRALAINSIVANRLLVRDALALSPGDSVLDVGSGNGEEALALGQIVGGRGRSVGVDASSTLVEEARRRTPTTVRNVEFLVADAHALPFAEGEFDAVRAERVLQHVDDPAQVAREIVRVTRTRGRVAAWEPDWGLIFIGSSDQRASAAVAERVAGATRNPLMGRNLARLLGRAGLAHVSVVPRVGLWETLEVVEERLRATATARALAAEGRLTESQAEDWLSELRDDAVAGRLVAGVCGFVVSGQKL